MLPPFPAMALCGELAALLILRTLRYGFEEIEALICLYCFLRCLGQTAWCELLWSSHPHLSSSLLILRQIKLLEKKKSVSHLLHISSHDATWKMSKLRHLQGGNCHRDGDLMQKLFFAYISKPSAPFSRYQLLYFFPWKLAQLQETACAITGLLKLKLENITVGHEK